MKPFVWIYMTQKFIDMLFNVDEGVSSGDVVNYDAAVCISEIWMCYWLVSFLSSCVPNLQFYHSIVYFQSFYFEVNSHRTGVILKYVVVISEEHACLANVSVSDQHYLVHGVQLTQFYVGGIFAYSCSYQITALFFLIDEVRPLELLALFNPIDLVLLLAWDFIGGTILVNLLESTLIYIYQHFNIIKD